MARLRLNLLHLYLLVWLGCVLAWLLLRVPEIRDALLALAPQRIDVPQSFVRRILAPRSIFLAPVVGTALLGLALSFFEKARKKILRPLTWRQSVLYLVLLVQFVLALSTVVNLEFFVARFYGNPVWMMKGGIVLRRTIPKALHHATLIKSMVPADARLALVTSAPLSANLLVPQLYPMRVFDPGGTGPVPASFVAKHGITHVLTYDPLSSEPVSLRPVR